MTLFGYFESNHEFPEEIITAAGMIPRKMRGNDDYSTNRADQHLSPFICGVARSIFDQALMDAQKYKGFSVVHGCDATNRQFDLWDQHVKNDFLHYIHHPLRTDHLALDFLVAEFQSFKEHFEKHFKLKISREDLNKSITLSNQIKQKCQNLSVLREIRDIPNLEYFSVMKYCIENDRHTVLPFLTQKIKKWKQKEKFPSTKIPIFLTGSDILHPDWYKFLEQANLRVIRDDQSLGERYFSHFIPTDNQNPLINLAKYYLSEITPATKHKLGNRLNYIIKACQNTHIKGIVSQNVKFCETFAYDAPALIRSLKEKGYQVLHLERDFKSNQNFQILTQMEAFFESLVNAHQNRNI